VVRGVAHIAPAADTELAVAVAVGPDTGAVDVALPENQADTEADGIAAAALDTRPAASQGAHSVERRDKIHLLPVR
jgi:hypothetical protein